MGLGNSTPVDIPTQEKIHQETANILKVFAELLTKVSICIFALCY